MGNVIDLETRRTVNDFAKDDKIAYAEMLWGLDTFAIRAAIRDLNAIREGTEAANKPLREPETDEEAEILIRNIRWAANYLAKDWGLEHLIRDGD